MKLITNYYDESQIIEKKSVINQESVNQNCLQFLAKKIRENCELVIMNRTNKFSVCTTYENKNLAITYQIKDNFGFITEIDEIRYGK